MKKTFKIIAAALLLIPTYVFADLNYTDVESAVSDATKHGVIIVESIIGLVLAIGLINAIYQTTSGKHESRDKIVGWGVGVILYIVGIIIINKIIGV